jgi:hypothetical protein
VESICFIFASCYSASMKSHESLKALLELPEMSSLGSAQERAAFIAVHIERRTVREAAQKVGVSKSQISNLVTLFLAKLGAKVQELERKRVPLSKEYVERRDALRRHLYELQEESGSDDFLDVNNTKIGNFSPGGVSREDWAEAVGLPLNDLDE